MTTFLCAILQAKQSSSIFVPLVCYETFAQCASVCVCKWQRAGSLWFHHLSNEPPVPRASQSIVCETAPLSSGGIDLAS